MTELHRMVSRETQDAKLLDLACGLRSLVERFDRLLATYVPGEPDEDALRDEDALVVAILGAIAIRNRLEAAFAGPALEVANPTPCNPPESLLR